jgi:anthranilate phosphoribosyltransferase
MIEIKSVIQRVVEGETLSRDEAAAAMDAVMSGQITGAQIGALVTALRMRGETIEEITGFASAMRDHALTVDIDSDDTPLLDTCGTGGDHSNSFNISTTATFAIAASGVRIAKHGNRAASSRCGSADLLEGLGVKVELTPAQVAESVEQVGVGFMYAPAFHPAMRYVGPTRREIGIRTVFNVLGPLTNPAGARHQLIGVGHPEIAGKLAEVLANLGSRRAVLVHGEEGLDEVGIVGTTAITEWDAARGTVESSIVTPMDYGLEPGTLKDIIGGDVEENVTITRAVLGGEQGPRRTITLMNAGAGIYAAEAAASFAEGIAMAAEAIDSGEAARKLDELVAFTNAIAGEEMREPA